MERKKITILLKVLLAITVVFSISATAAAAQSVCRDLPSGAQSAGSIISVDLVVTLNGATTYAIEDHVPADWEITNAPGGIISSDKQTVSYTKLGDGVDTTLTYSVKIPNSASAGTYSFSGEYGIGTSPVTPIGCTDLSVQVGEAPPPSDAEVCRNLPSGPQSAGSIISVDLVVTLNGATTYAIEDHVPADWEITNAPGGIISSDKQTVSYTKLGDGVDTTLTYLVKIPNSASAGTYSFSGEYGIGTSPLTPIICNDLSVSVGEAPTDGAVVCRDLPDGAQLPDSTFTVKLNVNLAGETTYAIEDHVPAGWHITNAPGGTISSDQQTVTYAKLGDGTDTILTYTVHIPADTPAGSYGFNGQYGIGTSPLKDISCTDMSVTVGEPITGITLQDGWNLFSVPCVLDNDSRDHVLDGVDYEAIIWFDASVQQWEDNPATIEPLTAYAINVNGTQVITNIECIIEYPIVPPSRHMYPGWNLVGLTSFETKTAEFTFLAGGIDDSYSRVWGPWAGHYLQLGYNKNVLDVGPLSGKDVYTESYIIKPYEGHWIFMEQDDTLIAIGP